MSGSGKSDVKGCWSVKTGVEIAELLADYDKKRVPEPSQRQFETLEFVNIYRSVPTFDLIRVVKQMLKEVFEWRARTEGEQSIGNIMYWKENKEEGFPTVVVVNTTKRSKAAPIDL